MIKISSERIRVVLPEKYDLVVGDTFQLFYRGVIMAPNPYVYDIVSVCEQGKNYPRYFEVTPTETGEYKLTIYIYNANRELVGQGGEPYGLGYDNISFVGGCKYENSRYEGYIRLKFCPPYLI